MILHVYIQHNSSVKKTAFKTLLKFLVGISSQLQYSLMLLRSVRRSNFGDSSSHISFAESQPASFVIPQSSETQLVSMFLKAKTTIFFVNSERAVIMQYMSFSRPSSARNQKYNFKNTKKQSRISIAYQFPLLYIVPNSIEFHC